MGVGSPLNFYDLVIYLIQDKYLKCFIMIIYLYMFCFYSEIMTPSLMNILKDNTLTGDNYVTWKRKIGLLLQSEKHKFVLTTPKPPAPNIESSIVQRDEYEQWKTSDDMAKCYIMATISDVLQQQHEGMGSAADMMMSLEEIHMVGKVATIKTRQKVKE